MVASRGLKRTARPLWSPFLRPFPLALANLVSFPFSFFCRSASAVFLCFLKDENSPRNERSSLIPVLLPPSSSPFCHRFFPFLDYVEGSPKVAREERRASGSRPGSAQHNNNHQLKYLITVGQYGSRPVAEGRILRSERRNPERERERGRRILPVAD